MTDRPQILEKRAIELQRIVELRMQGLSWRAVGAQLGKSAPAIFRYLKRHKPELLGEEVKVKPHRQPHTATTRAKMAAAHLGKQSGFAGKQHSAESRDAMSRTKRNRRQNSPDEGTPERVSNNLVDTRTH